MMRHWHIYLFVTASLLVPADVVQAQAKKGKAKMAEPKPMAPAGAPVVARLEPRGMQRSLPTKIKLTGSNLAELTAVKFSNAKLSGKLLKEPGVKATEAWVEVNASWDLPRGGYDLSVANAAGESVK